jgi:hypothetical protein
LFGSTDPEGRGAIDERLIYLLPNDIEIRINGIRWKDRRSERDEFINRRRNRSGFVGDGFSRSHGSIILGGESGIRDSRGGERGNAGGRFGSSGRGRGWSFRRRSRNHFAGGKKQEG